MRFQHIVQAVYFAPWAITRDGWESVSAIVRSRLQNPTAPLPKAEDSDVDFFGNQMPKMDISDGVAVIPISGTLIQHASQVEKMCGACSYDDISANLDAARDSVGLKTAVLNISSPGGMCLGNQETAYKIARMRESGIRMVAVTDSIMCSAAYNLAAGCNEIICTPSAVVGSIGAMAAILDQSLAFEMEGLKTELFTSGPLKGAGFPGTKLSDDQRAQVQRTVDHYASMFKAHVRKYRPVDNESMQGQVFIGQQAADSGLVDEVMEDVSFVARVDGNDWLDN